MNYKNLTLDELLVYALTDATTELELALLAAMDEQYLKGYKEGHAAGYEVGRDNDCDY